MDPSNLIRFCLFQYWEIEGDPRVKHYPLMQGGPLPVLAIIAVYLFFVKVAGPWFMKNREPFQLKNVILAYNIFNVLISVWFFFESIYTLDYGLKLFDYTFPSKLKHSPKLDHGITMLYIYMLSKFVDMTDSIFFVLRKKHNQASFLHVYHHAIVPLIVWMGAKLMPCAGPAGLFPLFNSLIHAIMYTYYTLAAMGPQYKNLLFWKKYVTILQLIQFFCYTVHGTLFLFLQTGYPKFVVYLGYVQNPLFLFMFYKFFLATYKNAKVERVKYKSM